MPNTTPRTRPLTIYLIKRGQERPSDILQRIRQLSGHVVRSGYRRVGHLYIKPGRQYEPAWWSFFQGAIDDVTAQPINQSTSAVLLTGAAGRMFAVTFGYGKALLQPGTFEEDFGIKVTLNAVDHTRVRSLDRVTLDTISRHSQIQASRAADIHEFGLDVEQDVLRAVTGPPRDAALGTKLTGKEALHATGAVALDAVRAFLERLLEEYAKTDYREEFYWVDHIQEVRDQTTIQFLDQQLVLKLRDGDFERVWLSPPDLVDWTRTAGFRYRDNQQAECFDDLHLREFINQIGDVAALDADALKHKHRVYRVASETGATEQTWSIYRCLYAEVEREGRQYLLNNGKWYRVEQNYLQEVNAFFAGIPTATVPLPDCTDTTEPAYNQRVAAEQPGVLALMDEHFIRHPGRSDKVEFCDLYTTSREMIHVKRYGASSVLSHLFAQGLVSGNLFFRDREFRHKVNAELPATHRLPDPDSRPRDGEYTIIFGIITKSAGPLTLPFFSRVNLRSAYQQLASLGYAVQLARIPHRVAAAPPAAVGPGEGGARTAQKA
jgi:uncharacterized protein (TIGR04141 family)